MRRLATCLLSLALAGCAAPDLERPSARAPIIDPLTDPYPDVIPDPYEAVVRVVIDRGACSGALIAPDRVLTARHCLLDERVDSPNVIPKLVAPKRIYVGIGGGWIPRATVPVRSIVTESSCGGVFPGEGDIAVLVLAKQVTAIPPLKVRTSMAPRKGELLSTAGFGMCHPTRLLARQVGPLGAIRATTETDIDLDAPACPGDSGAPALSHETHEVVGVVVSGLPPQGKPDPIGLDWVLGRKERPHATLMRVDTYADLLERARAVSEGASDDPKLACARPTPAAASTIP